MIATIGGDRACDGHVSVDGSRAVAASIRFHPSMDRVHLFVRSDAILRSIAGDPSMDLGRSPLRSASILCVIVGDRGCDGRR
jgi:hypothetical protein